MNAHHTPQSLAAAMLSKGSIEQRAAAAIDRASSAARDGWSLHDRLVMLVAPLLESRADLLAACRHLIDAPHQEHFATRLNADEMAGIRAIRAAIVKAEGC